MNRPLNENLIDSSTGARVYLNMRQIEVLEKQKELHTVIHQLGGKRLPLALYLKETSLRAEGLPIDNPYEEKIRYEIDLPSQILSEIKNRKLKTFKSPAINLPQLYISLDDVF